MPSVVKGLSALLQARGRSARIARSAVYTVVFLLVIKVAFNPPPRLYLFGLANGALYGLIAVGIILIYRTNRIINFAAAGMGAIPGVLCVLLNLKFHFPYFASLILALVLGVGLGALIDLVVIRGFAKAPRLILTVATLGVVQVLALVAVYIPQWLGIKRSGISSNIPTPWRGFKVYDSHHTPILTGDYVFAIVVVLVCGVGLASFFRFTRMGIALRASAENADRALLLGIPVRWVGTVSWMIAGLFGTLVIFVRSPLNGVPADGSLGFNVLIFALAAATVAKFDDVTVAIVAGMAVGIIEQGSVVRTGSGDLGAALMLVLILGALLLQRSALSRAEDSGVSTWQAVQEFRSTPRELRGVREVRIAYGTLAVVGGAIMLSCPYWLGRGNQGKLSLIPLYGIVAVSLVVLTGWAGQISLGQFGIVGASAAVAGGIAANHNIDFFAALALGIVAGVAIAVLIGIPALRVRGLYLAVTTLAFGGAMEFYVLKRKYWIGRHLLPSGTHHIIRPVLWGRINLSSDRSFYYVGLVFLALAVLCAKAFRKNRSGRILIATRDNAKAAPSYGINMARTKLAGFAVSGGIAGLAGVLFAYNQGAVDGSSYGIVPSIQIFLVTVIGGISTIGGALYGVVIIYASQFFLEPILTRHVHFDHLDLLFTGPGLLLGLRFLPGGQAQFLFENRDKFLRWVAARNDLLVPSLVADKRVEAKLEASVVSEAEHRVEEVDSFEVLGHRTISCPVCREVLDLDAAADHDHLRPTPVDAVGARA
ncbi:MAG: hypothetical protein NVS3B12_11630 [Acidimicrobiales bacterium]